MTFAHKYRIGLATRPESVDPDDWVKTQFPDGRPSQVRLWWRYGTKDEVLELRNAPMSKVELGWSESMITLGGIPDVELAIEE